MKTSSFELIANFLIAILVVVSFATTNNPLVSLITIICLGFFAVLRYVYHAKPLRDALTKANYQYDKDQSALNVQSNYVNKLEGDVKSHLIRIKHQWNDMLQMKSLLLRYQQPELLVVHEKPAKGTIYFKIHQGKDTKWYYSLIGTTKGKEKYIFNSKCYDTYALAATAIAEITAGMSSYVVYDEYHCLPETLTKDTFAMAN